MLFLVCLSTLMSPGTCLLDVICQVCLSTLMSPGTCLLDIICQVLLDICQGFA